MQYVHCVTYDTRKEEEIVLGSRCRVRWFLFGNDVSGIHKLNETVNPSVREKKKHYAWSRKFKVMNCTRGGRDDVKGDEQEKEAVSLEWGGYQKGFETCRDVYSSSM